MPTPHPLGDYLRARRELVQPADVGIAPGPGLRRVTGLDLITIGRVTINDNHVRLDRPAVARAARVLFEASVQTWCRRS